MPDYPIDLGKEMGSPIPMSEPTKPAKEKYYPCLFLDWDDEYNLPESGVMTVRFHKKSETTRTHNGETTQSVELEVKEILDVKSNPHKKEKSGSEALDEHRNSGTY